MEASDVMEAINMQEYLSQYCDFEFKGGQFWSLSPFKTEKTPSFAFDPTQGYWYDFSAGFGGNLVDFVMQYHHLALAPAMRHLVRYAGLSEDSTQAPSRMNASRIARKYRHSAKPERATRASPLPDNIMDSYEFRRDKLQLWADEGISFDTMKRFGVRYDSLDNRIVYPVWDYEHKIISVCGRTVDPNYKEKGLRKYTYFQSLGNLNTIYGYSINKGSILERREIILFEGAKSVMKAYGWGYSNGGALLTSHLSEGQMKFLIQLASWHGVRVVFALDADVDVRRDANILRLSRYATVEYITDTGHRLDAKDAPVDQGEEVFNALYSERRRIA